MQHAVLIIDDDPAIHKFLDAFISPEYETFHAETAQEAIDILSRQPVNLIMTDVHMPGLSGLEFLESLKKDQSRSDIPILIMTSLPTKEKEELARSLGAVDFMPKTAEFFEPEAIIERVRMKLLSDIDLPHISDEKLNQQKQRVVNHVMLQALTRGFEETMEALCQELMTQFGLKVCLFCVDTDGRPERTGVYLSDIDALPEDYTDDLLAAEPRVRNMATYRDGYLSNHAMSPESGIMAAFSRAGDLPAEIGIPIYQIQERDYLLKKEIPENAELFAFCIMKRNTLFSSDEFEMVRALIHHMGPILWRLYRRGQ